MRPRRQADRQNRLPHGSVAIVLLLMPLTSTPGVAQEIVRVDGTEAQRTFRLPMNHRTSIYFPPASAELTASAMASIVATAARLKTESGLRVTLVGFADDLDETAHGEELRASRVAAVMDALLEDGVPRQHISAGTMPDEPDTRPCTSEYCRQSYRRVALIFSKASNHQGADRRQFLGLPPSSKPVRHVP